jgi:stage II sporulation protein D
VREALKIYSGTLPKTCQVINEMDLEHYLVGVVNGEFSSRWNENAIAAQVVAARSYALHQLRFARRELAHYDVETDTRDQVYAGVDSEDFSAHRVVEMTRGQVLVASSDDGSALPIKAFYHSTCGGRTDSPARVFGKVQPGIGHGVYCGYCNSSPRYKWSLRVTPAELKQAFGFDVSGLSIVSSWDSGRVRQIEILSRSGAFKLRRISATELRSKLGVERVRSTAFVIDRQADGTWLLSGRGNGHGVGMCQWGAKEMGAQGESYPKILSHYYPDSQLRRLW